MIANLLARFKKSALPNGATQPTVVVQLPLSSVSAPYLVSMNLTVYAATEEELLKQVLGICDRYRNNPIKLSQMSHETADYAWEVKYFTHGSV